MNTVVDIPCGNNACFLPLSGDGSSKPIVSSGRKQIIRGIHLAKDGGGIPAVMLVYDPQSPGTYPSELEIISRLSAAGVGPRLLSGYAERPEGPALVEEDCGISLYDAVYGFGAIPGSGGDYGMLHPVGTEERGAENAKILFDVLTQLANLHGMGLYHGDLRLPNVCVRAYGDGPTDLRATIIDFDRMDAPPSEPPRYGNEPYPTLFGNDQSPTWLQLDMGYLAEFAFELETGRQAADVPEKFSEYVSEPDWPVFGYQGDGRPWARDIDRELDIVPLAETLDIDRVDEQSFPDASVRDYVLRSVHHGGYVDEYDWQRLREDKPEIAVFGGVDALARLAHERYNELRAERGEEVKYPTLDDLPDDLRESNREQVMDIPLKIQALGYRIRRCNEVPPRERVEAFSESEIEYLAYLEHRRWCAERKAMGWIYGQVKDEEMRTCPYLIPYSELDSVDRKIKDYDREPVRQIIYLLAKVGLCVTR